MARTCRLLAFNARLWNFPIVVPTEWMFELIWLPVSPQKQLSAFLWPTNKVLCSCVSLSKNNSQLAPPNRKAFRSLMQLAVVDGEPLKLSSPPFRRAAGCLWTDSWLVCIAILFMSEFEKFWHLEHILVCERCGLTSSLSDVWKYSLYSSSTNPSLKMNCLTFKLSIQMVPRYAECRAIEGTIMIMKLNIAGWQGKYPCCPKVIDKKHITDDFVTWKSCRRSWALIRNEAAPGWTWTMPSYSEPHQRRCQRLLKRWAFLRWGKEKWSK